MCTVIGVVLSVAITLALLRPAIFDGAMSGHMADAIRYPDVADSIQKQCEFRAKQQSQDYSDCIDRLWNEYHVHTLRDR